MPIRTKSIFDPASPEDGVRISVMNRHTLRDGTTPDERITPLSYDKWQQDLAPPSKLVGDHYKRGLPAEHYVVRYFKHLQKEDIAPQVQALARRALEETITLLCDEPREEAPFCHRSYLAQEMQKYEPTLRVEDV